MKLCTWVIIFILFHSCGKRFFDEVSQIQPIAQAKTFHNQYVDEKGKYLLRTFYFPLTHKSFAFYDSEKFLGAAAKEGEFVKNIAGKVNKLLKNVGMKALSKNNVKISTKFDEEDYKDVLDKWAIHGPVQRVRLKNVLFYVVPCSDLVGCDRSKNDEQKISLDFINELFVEAKAFDKYNKLHQEDIDSPYIFVKKKDYKKKSANAFSKTMSERLTSGIKDESSIILRYKNDENQKSVSSYLIVSMKKKNLLSDFQKHIVENKVPNIKVVQSVGNNNLFIEIKDDDLYKETALTLKNEYQSMGNVEDIKISQCTKNMCARASTNGLNAVELTAELPEIKLDTYISLNKLKDIDFEYRALLELEVKVYIP